MAYIPKLSPTVGNGLGGMPERRESASTVQANLSYTDYMLVYNKSSAPFVKLFKRIGDSASEILGHGIDLAGAPTNIRFSPKGTYITACVGSTLVIYKFNKGACTLLTTISGWASGVVYCEFSDDETKMAVGTGESNTTTNIKVYSVSNDIFSVMPTLSNQVSGVSSRASFSPDGSYLCVISSLNANGSYGGKIYKYDGSNYNYLTEVSAGSDFSNNLTAPIFDYEGLLLFLPDNQNSRYKVYQRTNDTFALLTTSYCAASLNTIFSPTDHSYGRNGLYICISNKILLRVGITQIAVIDDDAVNPINPRAISPISNYAFSLYANKLAIAKVNNFKDITRVYLSSSAVFAYTSFLATVTIQD
jgi:hypothetical protein